MNIRVSNTRIYIVTLAITYEIKIQEHYQNECTLRFVCIPYFFHSDSFVSVRSKRAIRAEQDVPNIQRISSFFLCVETRCSLLQSVLSHSSYVVTLVSRFSSSEWKPQCSRRLLLNALPVPEIADTSSGALVVCIINIR